MKWILFCLFFLSAWNIQSQVESRYVSLDAEPDMSLPYWTRLMYQDDPDIAKVITAYEAFYKEHSFVKNEHTQYYKRLLKSIVREVKHDPRNNRRGDTGSRTPDWTSLGPWDWDHDAAGRSYAPGSAHIYCVEQSISNPDVLYAGSATAGVWKSIDRGLNWTSLTEDLDVNGVYAIEIDHSNPNIAYASLFNSIYKTTDGGSSWNPTGDAAFQSIGLNTRDIMMHPTNNQIVIVAAEAGLFRTTDGGVSWTQLSTEGHRDIEFHPSNSDVVYGVRILGDSTKFVKSVNAGASFNITGNGWPQIDSTQNHQRRTEIAVSPDQPDWVYALATGSDNGGSGLFGIYLSTDEGVNWTFQCCGPYTAGYPDVSTGNINIMAWNKNGTDNGGQYYYNVGFAISPTNADSLWAAGTNLWKSGDQGVTMTCPTAWSEPGNSDYVHADIHDIHYYDHTGEIWMACDGGIFVSVDNGASFERRVFGIEGSDFWGFGQGFWEGDIMLGGTYHNGTLLKEDTVYINDWICTDGGDGNYGMVNPGRPKNVHSWFNIKDLQSNRTIAPITRGNPYEANASYIIGEDSDLLYHPNYYDTWWVGSGNKVMYTEDNGFTFEEKYDFGVKVVAMDISNSNPDVLYAATWPGWWDVKRLYRSDDGGTTWTDITIPTNQLNGSTWVPYDIVVDPLDPMRVFVARTSMYSGTNINGARLFESTDGGNSWSEIGGSELNNVPLTNITGYFANEGALVIGTRKGVWYRDDVQNICTNISSDLPVSSFSEKLYPYYRKRKIRNATNRSVWERNLPTAPQRVIARAATDRKEYYCTSDTIEYLDLSIVTDENITYQWTFPGGTPSASTERSPKVVYECPGDYKVTLMVSDNYGTDTKTYNNFIRVWKDCENLEDPGFAVKTTDVNDHVYVPEFGMTNVTSLTVTAWVNPDGIQDAYTGIFMGDGTAAGINFKNNNELGYHWPGGSWSWNSGLVVPSNEWSQVALVVTPNNVTIYLNGVPSVHNVNINPVDINAMRLASYKDWDSRNYRGTLDEVVIYDRALSIDEIRQKRHIAVDPASDPSIYAYYKFNRGEKSLAFDSANGHHGNIRNSSIKIVSNGPYGLGVSDLINIVTDSIYTCPNSGVVMDFGTGGYPDGDVVVSHIITNPGISPSNDHIFTRGYYIFNNYGNNSTFNGLDQIAFTDAGMISNYMTSNVSSTFLHRGENEGTGNWTSYSTGPFILNAGIFGGIEIPNSNFIRKFGEQFVFTRNPFTPDIANVSISSNTVQSPAIEGGSSAEFALISDHKGLILPFHNDESIDSLNSPFAGSVLYDTLTQRIHLFDGANWLKVVSKTEFFDAENLISPTGFGIDMNGSQRDSAAILNLADAGGVILLPEFSKAQMLAIDKPSPGMLVFNSDDNVMAGFNGTAWMKFETESTALQSSGSTEIIKGASIGKSSKHPSASLEISSAQNKTLLLTRVETYRISNPTLGLFVFDTARKEFMIYNGIHWEAVKAAFLDEN